MIHIVEFERIKALQMQGFCAIMKKSQKSRICLSERVPKLTARGCKDILAGFKDLHICGSKKPNGGKNHERYFNEATFRSRCSLRTSDKKMES